MEVRNPESSSFEERVQHVKCGEQRIAEMEHHVHYLRQKLCRLEKMLPPTACIAVEHRSSLEYQDSTDCSSESPITKCPVDELAKKEKYLRKQIYRMECTEQAYKRQLADIKENSPKEKKKPLMVNQTPRAEIRRKREAIQKQRLSLLETYSQKLCSNLQSLNNNHAGLTQEARNLTEVLDKTRKGQVNRQRVHPCSTGFDNTGKCGCNKLAQCNSCIVCTCDEWERDLEILKGDSQKESLAKKEIPFSRKQPVAAEDIFKSRGVCSCCDDASSSSSDSEESCKCECKIIKSNCNFKNEDVLSVATNLSDDDDDDNDDNETFCSDNSKCVCYRSKCHSHGNSLDSDSDISQSVKHKKVERFRGGQDTVEERTTVVSLKSNRSGSTFPTFSNAVMDHLKLLRVEELRDGLERLKIRNQNLRDFLHNFDSPMSLVNKSSEVTSIYTDVSSCYTLEQAKQTRSGLLTVIKVLEGKCRSKDAVIIALTDELKNNTGRKSQLQNKTPHSSKNNSWKSLKQEKKSERLFTKKDSAVGFLLFLAILISHVKRSEMISYFSAAKKIMSEMPFKLVLYINETEKLSADFLVISYGKIANLTRELTNSANNSWKQMHLWLERLFQSAFSNLDLADRCLIFINSHKFHATVLLAFCFAVILTTKFRKSITSFLRNSNHVIRNKCITSKDLFSSLELIVSKIATFFKTFLLTILTSRMFWVIVGFYTHIMWDRIKENILQPIYDLKEYFSVGNKESVEEAFLEAEILEEDQYDFFERSIYSWIFYAFRNKLQSFINFSCFILENILS